MSKAKDLAEKAYPQGDTYIFGDASIACQVAYVKGYHQAEKDLGLTWEDIALINDIVSEMLRECSDNILYDTEKDFCQEVLKRFKDYKK